MILDQYLSESGLIGENYDVEPTNEGFDFDFGGIERINDLCESDSHALNMAVMLADVRTCQLMNEGANLEASQLQENVFSSFWEKLKTIVKKMWARVKEVLNSVLLQFTKLANDKAFLTRAKKIMNDSKFDTSGLEVEGFIYTLDAFNPLDAYNKMIKAAGAKFNITCDAGSDKEDAAKKADDAKKKLDDAISDSAIDDYVKAGYGCVVSDLDDTLFKALRNGKDTSEQISFNKSDCVKAIEGYKSRVNSVNSLKTQMDSAYKNALKTITDLQKENDKQVENAETQGPRQQLLRGVYTKHGDMLKTLLTHANKGCSAKLKAFKDERSQAKSMIMKAISKSNKNRKENATKTWGDSTDLLGNLMDQFN